MKEIAVENYLIRRVRDLGGLCYKFEKVRAGAPDRICILPGNNIFFVECKRPGVRRLRPAQTRFMKRLHERGCKCFVVNCREDIDRCLDSMTSTSISAESLLMQ